MPLFYLCQTEDGPQLAPNQASAKVLDKDFQPHEIPADKPGLMGYVNTLLKRVRGEETNANIETVLMEPVIEKVPIVITKQASKVPNGCPACDRTPVAASSVAQSDTATEIEDIIWKLDREHLLKNIIEVATERLGELASD
jgi:hypothetical protein